MSTVIASFTETLGISKPGYISIADNGDYTATVTVHSSGLLGTTSSIHMTKSELTDFLDAVGVKIAPVPVVATITSTSKRASNESSRPS